MSLSLVTCVLHEDYPFFSFYVEEFVFDFGSFQIPLVFLTLTFKECPNGEGWGEEWGKEGAVLDGRW